MKQQTIDDFDRVAVVEEVNENSCSQQPLFSSAQAAEAWVDAHPGGRVFPVEAMLHRPFFTHVRDSLRARTLANVAADGPTSRRCDVPRHEEL